MDFALIISITLALLVLTISLVFPLLNRGGVVKRSLWNLNLLFWIFLLLEYLVILPLKMGLLEPVMADKLNSLLAHGALCWMFFLFARLYWEQLWKKPIHWLLPLILSLAGWAVLHMGGSSLFRIYSLIFELLFLPMAVAALVQQLRRMEKDKLLLAIFTLLLYPSALLEWTLRNFILREESTLPLGLITFSLYSMGTALVYLYPFLRVGEKSPTMDDVPRMTTDNGQKATMDDGAAAGSPVSSNVESHELSKREWDVALLAKQGLSSRDIGDTLHISKRTVDRHLENIYGKLGVSNRFELIHRLQSTVNG